MSGSAHLRRQGGQALVEFLVIALALLPLFLLTPMIAKYQDIRHKNLLASRYAAFEATIRNDSMSSWKPETQLADEIRRRYFSNSDAAIKTNDVAGDFDANRNLFWVDPQGNPLIKQFSDVNVSFGDSGGTTQASGFSSASDRAPFAMLAGPMDMGRSGIYTAQVSVNLAKLPAGLKFYEPFDQIELSMTDRTSLLIDPWAAVQGPQQVESRVANSPLVFPAGALTPLGAMVDPIVAIVEAPGGIRGPKLGQLEFWRDVVPQDRLRAGN